VGAYCWWRCPDLAAPAAVVAASNRN